MNFWVKTAITCLLTVGIAELSKRNAMAGAFVNALPLQSLIIILWMFCDSGEVDKIADLSRGMLWALPGTIMFFAALLVSIRCWHSLWPSLGAATATAGVVYGAMQFVRKMVTRA